jgi:hypothetical protein
LGVVLVRLGIAKVDQQPISEVLRNMAVKALDHRGAGILVGAHQRTVVLRVEPPGQSGRLDQITEQHRQLAAFGLRSMRGMRCWVRETAGGTGPGQLGAASTAEVHPFKVGKTAVRTEYRHTLPP